MPDDPLHHPSPFFVVIFLFFDPIFAMFDVSVNMDDPLHFFVVLFLFWFFAKAPSVFIGIPGV